MGHKNPIMSNVSMNYSADTFVNSEAVRNVRPFSGSVGFGVFFFAASGLGQTQVRLFSNITWKMLYLSLYCLR